MKNVSISDDSSGVLFGVLGNRTNEVIQLIKETVSVGVAFGRDF
jgi:dihydrodipicolinate synthase/N-acetylneuraminate lyase